MLTSQTLTLAEARRIALAAQGFDKPRPARRIAAADIRRIILQLGLLQLDFVNNVTPAHYTVLFSRLGPYDTALFHKVVYESGEFMEQWAHAASIVPVDAWPLLRHRQARREIWPRGFAAFLEKHSEYATWVIDEVRRRGPLLADDLPAPGTVDRRMRDSWYGTVPRATLEAHFSRGLIGVSSRRPNFSRLYDLPERIVPAEHYGRELDDHDAQRELLRRAARACGIGTTVDFADYYRMPVTEARPRLLELAEAGELSEVKVEGRRVWMSRDARVPARIGTAALLAPFDPLIWFRPRVRWLFGFDYLLEVFIPKSKRRWGPYVLPFLRGDKLVARVDLKANRAAGRLDVPGAFLEEGVEAGEVVGPLAAELRAMAGWLGLKEVAVGRRGNLANALRRQ